MSNAKPEKITGRCYCGAVTFSSTKAPEAVVYCHCDDCRRAGGAPVSAFAAFDLDAIRFVPNAGKSVTVNDGACRTFCPTCGSSLTGTYDYLPDQIYVALGVIDQADQMPPEIHAHAQDRLPWLHIQDDVERCETSARATLNTKAS